MDNFYRNQLIVVFVGFIVLMSTVPTKVLAQSNERFSVYHERQADSDNVSTSNYSLRAGHQLILDEEGSNLLTFSLSYTEVILEDSEATGPDRHRLLKSVVPEAYLLKTLNELYSMVVIFRPGFYGDLKGGLANDFRLEGGALVSKVMSDSLTLGLGVGRGTNFGRDLIVPLVQVLYFASDKILVRGILPTQASVWYIPDQKWEYGGLFRISGSLYQIENTDLQDVEGLGFGAVNIGGSIRRNLFEKSFLVLEAGVSMMRRYEWRGENSPSFITADDPDFDRDLGTVPYMRIGWQHRL